MQPTDSVTKYDRNRETMQWGVGPSHKTPAAASAGLQPARLARSGNRAFTRRAETTSIGLKPMRLALSTTRQIQSEKPWRQVGGATAGTFEEAARAASAYR